MQRDLQVVHSHSWSLRWGKQHTVGNIQGLGHVGQLQYLKQYMNRINKSKILQYGGCVSIILTPTAPTWRFPSCVLRHQLMQGFPVLLSELGHQNELAASKSCIFPLAFSNFIKA
jgi:hypothetical protein